MRGFQDGWFQQTWFTKPERKAAYIGAIFDDHTGEIRWADNTLMGDYCIADKTIYFSPSSRSNETLVIEILNISEDRMTLKMPDGQELMLYNPYPDLNQEIDLGSPVK